MNERVGTKRQQFNVRMLPSTIELLKKGAMEDQTSISRFLETIIVDTMLERAAKGKKSRANLVAGLLAEELIIKRRKG